MADSVNHEAENFCNVEKQNKAPDNNGNSLQARPGNNIPLPATPPQRISFSLFKSGARSGNVHHKNSVGPRLSPSPNPNVTTTTTNEASHECNQGHTDCPASNPKMMKDVGEFAKMHGFKLVPAGGAQAQDTPIEVAQQLPTAQATSSRMVTGGVESAGGGYRPDAFAGAPYGYPYGGFPPPLQSYPGWNPNHYPYGPYPNPYPGYAMGVGAMSGPQPRNMGLPPMTFPQISQQQQQFVQQQRDMSMSPMSTQVLANMSKTVEKNALNKSSGFSPPNKPVTDHGQPMGAPVAPPVPHQQHLLTEARWVTPGVRLLGIPYARLTIFPDPDIHIMLPTTDRAILLGMFMQYLREVSPQPGPFGTELNAFAQYFWAYIQKNFPPAKNFEEKEAKGKAAMANFTAATRDMVKDMEWLNTHLGRMMIKKGGAENPRDSVVPSKEERPKYLKDLKDAILRINDETVDANRPSGEKIRNTDPNNPMWENAAEKLLYALEKMYRDMVELDEPQNPLVLKARRDDFDQQFQKVIKYLEVCKGGCLKLTLDTLPENVARDPGSKMKIFVRDTTKAISRESKDAEKTETDSPNALRTTRKASEEVPDDGKPPPTKIVKTDAAEVHTPPGRLSVKPVPIEARTRNTPADPVEVATAKMDKVNKKAEAPPVKTTRPVSAEIRPEAPPQIAKPRATEDAPAIAKTKPWVTELSPPQLAKPKPPAEGRIAKTKAKDDTSDVYGAMIRFAQAKAAAAAEEKAKLNKPT